MDQPSNLDVSSESGRADQSLGILGSLNLDSPAAIVDEIEHRSLILVSGKGGVGRSTVAAMIGAELASRGRKVLVATTGQDDRLAWMFGRDNLTDRPQLAANSLWIQRLDPLSCVKDYATLILPSAKLAEYVLDRQTVRRFLRAVPGFDDFSVLGKVWHEATRASNYDHVIFDGAASGHLKLALGVPAALAEALPESSLRREALAMDVSLRSSKQCSALLVGLPEAWPLTELVELADSLEHDRGIHVAGVLINRLRSGVSHDRRSMIDWTGIQKNASVPSALRSVAQRMVSEGQSEAEVIRQFLELLDRKDATPKTALLPWYEGPFDGVQSLRQWAGLAD